MRSSSVRSQSFARTRCHSAPFHCERAQIALLELGALEPAVVAVGAAQIEPLERHAVEIDAAQPDRRRREPGDRAPGELVLGDQPLELDARLDDAGVGARVAHPDEDTPRSRRRRWTPLRRIWLRVGIADHRSRTRSLIFSIASLERLLVRPPRSLRAPAVAAVGRRAGSPPLCVDRRARPPRLRPRALRRTACRRRTSPCGAGRSLGLRDVGELVGEQRLARRAAPSTCRASRPSGSCRSSRP